MSISCLTKPTQNKQIRENYRGCVLYPKIESRYVIREDWDTFKKLNFTDRSDSKNNFKIFDNIEIVLIFEPDNSELESILKKYNSKKLTFKNQNMLAISNSFNFNTGELLINLYSRGRDNKENIIATKAINHLSFFVLQYLPKEVTSFAYSGDFIIYNLKGACTAQGKYIDNGAQQFLSGVNVEINALTDYSINVLQFKNITKIEDIWSN